MKAQFVNVAVALSLATSFVSAEVAKSPLSAGINNLNYKVLNQVAKTEKKDKNLFLSAFSIHEAVSMAYTGSTGATQTELATLLGLNREESMENLADTWALLRTALQSADQNVKLEIANSMWGNSDQRVKFLPEFVSLNKRAHDAELRTENFQTEEFLTKINGWASEKTKGKIQKVLSGPIPREQLFYLVNAIYFKGDWTKAFDKKNTREGQFNLIDKKQAKANFMTQGGYFNYAQTNDGSQAVEIPFGKSKRMVMAMYLPAEGSKLLSNLDARALAQFKLARREGTITIPRFSIEYGNEEMVKVLEALGVRVAFSDNAQFPNVAEGEDAVKINKIIHKAVVDVMEEGAEAAAVTVVGGVRATSVGVNPPFYFRADRPFYFEIKDNETGVVLFSGILKNPAVK